MVQGSRPYQSCTQITPTCPVDASVYGYQPSLGANFFFLAWFAILGVAQFVLGLRYKTWTYWIAMTLACLFQVIGYIGRVMLHNVWNQLGFKIQIVFLIVGPAFNAAALYLVLKHIALGFGSKYSRIPPRWYTYIFITGDIVSLVLQAAGGALAASATTKYDTTGQETGNDLMLTGVSWQVFTLLVFGIAALDYILRRRAAIRTDPLGHEATIILKSLKFRLFAMGVSAAYFAVSIRCIYRIVEMASGWRGSVMQNEASFIVLDGW